MELQDIDGLGPAREESLVEAGYGSVEKLADADDEKAVEIAEEANIPEDTVLEFVVQAQNLVGEEELDSTEFDLQPKDISDEVELKEKEVEPTEASEAVEEAAEESSDERKELVEVYSVELQFNDPLEYHTFHDALMEKWASVYSGNEETSQAIQKCLRALDGQNSFERHLSEYELNQLHSAVLQKRISYQGDNLIDHMDALREVENQIDEQRNEHLF